jgi:hypothetical protein
MVRGTGVGFPGRGSSIDPVNTILSQPASVAAISKLTVLARLPSKVGRT